MTGAKIFMPDAVNVDDLPQGYPAYLGYVDGEFITAAGLARMFPDAELVLLTVKGGNALAHGARVVPGEDTEPGDLTAAAAVQWAAGALAAVPASRPVLYASVQGQPGYGMPDVLLELHRHGIARNRVRLLSAHYTHTLHVCGPGTCKAIGLPMDGAQWTDEYRTRAGTIIDMSLLNGDFFQAQPALTEEEKIVQKLGIVRQGDTGPAVRTVQALCNARLADQAASGRLGPPPLAVDGVFGLKTQVTVEMLQAGGKVTQDGIVGPVTWPVLLGIE